ncbi:MAG: cell division protein FtsQ/DivIB [Proteobacteria bacterium]|nr:cell division protein FtsQ/DivIB [Pseudomonadota bacterium]
MPNVTRRPSNSVNDRPGRLKILLRRGKRRLRPIAWAAFGLAVVLFGYGLIHSGAPGSWFASVRARLAAVAALGGMRVTDVVIEGRANTPEPLLRAAIGVSRGDPILGFSVSDARQRIETLTWVEHATVERRLPGTIVVKLDERRPFAVWQYQGKFALIDRDGQLVANQDVSLFHHLPLVVGAGAPQRAAALLDALAAHPALQARVIAAVRVGERRWNLRLNTGTDVLLPEGHEVAALDRLTQLQQDHALLDRPLQVVDLRLPDRLVVRPRPDARTDASATPPARNPT